VGATRKKNPCDDNGDDGCGDYHVRQVRYCVCGLLPFSRYQLNGIPKLFFALGLHIMLWGPVALLTFRFGTAMGG
jgi:hypothetical protein